MRRIEVAIAAINTTVRMDTLIGRRVVELVLVLTSAITILHWIVNWVVNDAVCLIAILAVPELVTDTQTTILVHCTMLTRIDTLPRKGANLVRWITGAYIGVD